MFSPNSIDEYLHHEEQAERREEALSRKYRRQQYELFDEVMELDPPCPNCGETGYEPVYGVSEDASVGYSAQEQACVACMGRTF